MDRYEVSDEGRGFGRDRPVEGQSSHTRDIRGLKRHEDPLTPEERTEVLEWQRSALTELRESMVISGVPDDDVAKHITDRSDEELELLFKAYLTGCNVLLPDLEGAWRIVLPHLEKISDVNRGHILNICVRTADGDPTLQAILLAQGLATFVHNTWQWLREQYGPAGTDLIMEYTKRHLDRYDA